MAGSRQGLAGGGAGWGEEAPAVGSWKRGWPDSHWPLDVRFCTFALLQLPPVKLVVLGSQTWELSLRELFEGLECSFLSHQQAA